MRGAIAQLVERFNGIEEVRSSSLLRSIKIMEARIWRSAQALRPHLIRGSLPGSRVDTDLSMGMWIIAW